MFDKPIPAFELLERVVGVQCATLLRWMLFLPLSLVIGVVVFVIIVLLAKNSGDEDMAGMGGLVAGFIGGICSVFAGLAIAPRHTGTVALITAIADVALAGTFVYWARSSDEGGLFIARIIAGGVYSFSALTVAVSFVKLSRQERSR